MRYILIIIPILFLALSCNPNEKVLNETESIEDLLKDLESPAQKYTFDIEKGITLKGQEGILIEIKPNSLMYENGNDVKGEVSIELIECYELSELLIHNLATVDLEGKLIETAGMLWIKASSKGKTLTLKDKECLNIGFPKIVENDFGLFYGRENKEGQFIEWEQQDKSVASISSVISDTLTMETMLIEGYSEEDYYFFSSSKLGWLNCDRYPIFEKSSNLIVTVDHPAENIKLRLILTDMKAVRPAFKETKRKYSFSAVPINEKFFVFGFYESKGVFYVGKSETNLLEGQTKKINLEFEEMSKEAAKEFIKGMVMW